MKEVSGQIDAFLAFLRFCEQQYHMAEADEREANNETQDILHSLELEPHDYRQLAALGRELRSVRRRRRQAKDTAGVTAPVLRWMEENRPVIKGLERLLGEMRKVEKRMENRVYIPRSKREGGHGGTD